MSHLDSTKKESCKLNSREPQAHFAHEVIFKGFSHTGLSFGIILQFHAPKLGRWSSPLQQTRSMTCAKSDAQLAKRQSNLAKCDERRVVASRLISGIQEVGCGNDWPVISEMQLLKSFYRLWWVRAPHAVLVPKKSIGHNPPFAKSEWQGRLFLEEKVEPGWLGRALLEKFACSV